MEQNLPRCVRQAWDSVEESQEPEMLPLWIFDSIGAWSLPLYPKLDHLTWGDQEINPELYSGPCGLLHQDCPQHGPRAQNGSRQGLEPPAPDPTPKTQEPESPPGEVAAVRSLPDASPPDSNPRDGDPMPKMCPQDPEAPPGEAAVPRSPAAACLPVFFQLAPSSRDTQLEPDT